MKRKFEENDETSNKKYRSILNIETWFPFSCLKNYLIDDPLVDYLKIFNGKPLGDNFDEFLKKRKNQFKCHMFSLLKEKFGNDIIQVCENEILTQFEETTKLINNKFPVIYRGLLTNDELNVYSVVDLIIRVDYLSKLDPNIKINTSKSDYIIIIFKYNDLKSNEICKSKLVVMNYNIKSTFGYVLEEKNKSYELNFIDLTSDYYLNKSKNAVNWAISVNNNDNMSLYPNPSRYELYPNMKINNRIYHKQKKNIALILNDITLLWKCNNLNRAAAFGKRVTCWSDKACTSKILGIKGKNGKLLQRILNFNQNEKLDIYYPEYLTSSYNKSFNIYLKINYLDEIFYSSKIILIITVLYQNSNRELKLKKFIADSLNYDSEKKLLIEFIDWHSKINEKYGINNIFYWDDINSISEIILNSLERNKIKLSGKLKLSSLNKFLQNGNVLIRNLLDFDYKEVLRKLFELNIINYNIKNKDEYYHMYKIWKYYQNEENLTDIIKHNRNICYGSYRMFEYFKKNCAKNNSNIHKMIMEVSNTENLNEKEISELFAIERIIHDKNINMKKILNSTVSINKKSEIAEKYLAMQMRDRFSSDYRILRDDIYSSILDEDDDLTKDEKIKYKQLEKIINNRKITLKQIINCNLTDNSKADLIERYQTLKTVTPTSRLYNNLRKEISSKIEGNIKESSEFIEKVKKSDFNQEIKEKLLFEIGFLDGNEDNSDYYKRKNWLKFVVNLPTQVKKFTFENVSVNKDNPKDFLKKYEIYIRQKLDKCCYGMKESKDAIIDYLFKRIANPDSKDNIMALHGPKGVGKTHMVRALSEILELPLIKIGLGGANDASTLVGHRMTYVGAIPGKIVSGLKESKIKNPIIYLDEIDKTCTKSGGYSEVDGVLTHLLDPEHNEEFVDEYVGFPVDMSNVFWVISFNDVNKIDKILMDRLKCIYVEGYTPDQKLEITKNYLIPELKLNLKIKNEIIVPNEVILYIIQSTKAEEGVRNLKHNMQTLFDKLNRYLLTSNDIDGIPLNNPLIISKKIVDKLIKFEKDAPLVYFM